MMTVRKDLDIYQKLIITSALALASYPAKSQEAAQMAVAADDEVASDIIVTAQRRSERLQDVPIAVTAVQSETLEATGVDSLFDINLVAPGVKVQQYVGYAVPMIRGVTSKTAVPGQEPPVATYVDGVYMGASSANTSSFNNIARIEVLKGPQGTLFGRNATGGLIQIVTKDPVPTLGGHFNIGYGNYQTLEGDFYVTTPVAENVAADFSFSGRTQGKGYGVNQSTGNDVNKVFHDISLRSKILYAPLDALTIRVSGDYGWSHNNVFGAQRPVPFGVTPPAPYGPAFQSGNPWDIDSDQQPDFKLRGGGVSAKVDYDLGPVSIANIVAYRRTTLAQIFDSDYTAYQGRYALAEGSDEQFSEEFQILSAPGSKLNWTIGAYYYDAMGELSPVGTVTYGTAAVPGGPRPIAGNFTNVRTGTRSLSGYGQATLDVTPQLHLTGGLRYTTEKRTSEANTYRVDAAGTTTPVLTGIDRSLRFEKLTWRFSASYDVSDDAMIYTSYNRGFKSGGYNVQVVTLPPFEPETLDAYEVGAKTQFFDRRLTLNGSLYYYDYKNVQVARSVNGLVGTYNADGETIYGGELEVAARLTDRFTISGGYAYIHARYNAFPGAQVGTPRPGGGYTVALGDATGNTVQLTPTHSISLVGDYTTPLASGELKLTANYTFNSRYFQEPDNQARQPAYSLVGASAKWTSESGLSISIWGKNLTKEAVATIGGIQTFGGLGLERAAFSPPRTYGFTLGKEF